MSRSHNRCTRNLPAWVCLELLSEPEEVTADSVTSVMEDRAGKGGEGLGEGGSGPNWKGEAGSERLESEAESGSSKLVRLLLEVAGDSGW